MISWIQKTFHRHFKLVFAGLIVVMALPLVFIYSASGGLGRGERSYKSVTFFGVPFTSEAERRVVTQDGSFSLFLTSGQPYIQPGMAQVHSLRRLAALHLAKEYGIPKPTAKQLQDYIEQLPAFRGPDGSFDREIYTQLKDNFQTNAEYPEARVRRIIEQDWRIASVLRAMGGSGYVLDSEVSHAVAFVDTKWSMEVATVEVAKLPAPPEPTEEQIRKWFESYGAQYRVPERARVSYVEFPVEKFAGAVNLTDEQIVRYFEENKARYRQPAPAPAEGQASTDTPLPPEPTLEQVRPQVMADLTAARARNLAAKAASDFAYALFDKGISRGSPAFEALLAQHNLALKSLPPIPRGDVPAGLPGGQRLAQAAFRLDAQHPVSDAILAEDSAVVLFFEERIPETDATLADVRERVVADLRNDLRQRAVVSEGQALRARIQADMAAGKSFTEAAKAAGLEVKSWSDFTIREAPADIDRTAMAVMEDQPLNEISPMRVVGDRGLFVRVTEREAPSVSPESETFAAMRRNLLSREAQVLSTQLLDNLVQQEYAASGLAERPE